MHTKTIVTLSFMNLFQERLIFGPSTRKSVCFSRDFLLVSPSLALETFVFDAGWAGDWVSNK